jgi:hypothetical protein
MYEMCIAIRRLTIPCSKHGFLTLFTSKFLNPGQIQRQRVRSNGFGSLPQVFRNGRPISATEEQLLRKCAPNGSPVLASATPKAAAQLTNA